MDNFVPSASLPHPNMDKNAGFAKSALKTLEMQNLEDEYARHCQLLTQHLFSSSLLTGPWFFFQDFKVIAMLTSPESLVAGDGQRTIYGQ